MSSALWFWFRSRNRHGVHSPFVYDFLERSLYARKRPGCSPEQQLLLAASEHFAPVRVGASPSASDWAGWLKPHLPEALWGSPPYDLYIADRPGTELESQLADHSLWHNESVIFVGGLRSGTEARRAWKRLCALPRLRVSLETYRAGLLFFRRQQAPQHFKIRLKSSTFKGS